MKRLLFIFALLFSVNLFSEEGSAAKKLDTIEFSWVFSLDEGQERKSLKIIVPNKFYTKSKFEDFITKGKPLEYHLENENSEGGNEEIAIFRPDAASGAQLALQLKNIIPDEGLKSVVLKDEVSKIGSIEQTVVAVKVVKEDMQAVVYYVFFNGPSDRIGVLYVMELKEGQAISDVVKKIEQYFADNVSIVTSK